MAERHRKIGVLVGESPVESTRAKEAIRLSVGLTLRNPDVHLFLVGDGQDGLGGQAGGKPGPEFRKHLDVYLEMGCHLVLERESAVIRENIPPDLRAESWSREEIFGFLTRCDEVIIVGE